LHKLHIIHVCTVRPKFVRRPPDKVVVGVGHRVSVHCQVEAIPAPIIHWNRQHPTHDVCVLFITSSSSAPRLFQTVSIVTVTMYNILKIKLKPENICYKYYRHSYL